MISQKSKVALECQKPVTTVPAFTLQTLKTFDFTDFTGLTDLLLAAQPHSSYFLVHSVFRPRAFIPATYPFRTRVL